VWVDARFAWGRNVTIQQHGVKVRRTTKSTRIDFPSGHKVEVPGDAPAQVILDPEPVARPVLESLAQSPLPAKPEPSVSKRVSIDVEIEE
jgi:hypothetical protein